MDGLRQEQITFEGGTVRDYDVHPNGELLYVADTQLIYKSHYTTRPEVIATSVPDNGTQLWQFAQALHSPIISPNGQHLAYAQNGVRIYNLLNLTSTVVVDNVLPLAEGDPAVVDYQPWLWSPDGQQLLVITYQQAESSLLLYSTASRELLPIGSRASSAAWSPDGRSVFLAGVEKEGGCSAGEPHPVLQRVDVLTREVFVLIQCFSSGMYYDVQFPYITDDWLLVFLFAQSQSPEMNEYNIMVMPVGTTEEWIAPAYGGGFPLPGEVLWGKDGSMALGSNGVQLDIMVQGSEMPIQSLLVEGERLRWGP